MSNVDVRKLVGEDGAISEEANLGEQILRDFHNACERIGDKVPIASRIDLLASVDSLVCRMLTG